MKLMQFTLPLVALLHITALKSMEILDQLVYAKFETSILNNLTLKHANTCKEICENLKGKEFTFECFAVDSDLTQSRLSLEEEQKCLKTHFYLERVNLPFAHNVEEHIMECKTITCLHIDTKKLMQNVSKIDHKKLSQIIELNNQYKNTLNAELQFDQVCEPALELLKDKSPEYSNLYMSIMNMVFNDILSLPNAGVSLLDRYKAAQKTEIELSMLLKKIQ